MVMPEASVDEDRDPLPRKNDVRFAGQRPHVDTVAKAASVKLLPKEDFWLCIPTCNGGHDPTARI